MHLSSAPSRKPSGGRSTSIAIVGAGLSGLTAGRFLADQGHHVGVFEKSRGSGGRMGTRRHDSLRFDHGAQYFTARDEGFKQTVRAWEAEGLVGKWEGQIASVATPGVPKLKERTINRFVGIPGMNAVARWLAESVPVSYETEVASVEAAGGRWKLSDSEAHLIAESELLLVSAPAPQAAKLLTGQTPIAETVASVRMLPCWALMVCFDEPLPIEFDGAFIQRSPLSWAARNSTKPGRPEPESWVIHADSSWSQEHIEDSREQVVDSLPSVATQLRQRRWKSPRKCSATPIWGIRCRYCRSSLSRLRDPAAPAHSRAKTPSPLSTRGSATRYRRRPQN